MAVAGAGDVAVAGVVAVAVDGGSACGWTGSGAVRGDRRAPGPGGC